MRHLVLTLALALAACGGPPEGIQDRVSLKPFKDCKELEAYIKDTAVHEMRTSFTTASGLGFPTTVAMGAPTMDRSFAGEAGAASGVPDYSQTNTQVGGVDEADFVKTDGLRTFYLSGGRLLVLKTWPANETALLATVPIDGWPREMFLADKRLVVFSGTASWTYDETVVRPAGAPAVMSFRDQVAGEDATRITVFDVSSDTPVELKSYLLGGTYASSRRVGSAVRVVLSGSLSYPALEWVTSGGVLSAIGLDLERDRSMSENERRIRGRSLADWLPGTFVVKGGERVEVPYSCADFYQPNVAARLGLATVATLDLDALEGGVAQTSIVTQVGEVYASAQALYIASPHWWWAGLEGRHDHTYLHKLDLQASDKVSYVASGGVSGHIVDQFSMDEHDGFFRVAATTQQWGAGRGLSTTDTSVSVLAERSGRLEIVGRTENLAPGERIFSSRFSGGKGFVVTFRQVDPLFTLDLSDPVAPRVLGSLELPGVSTYIHLLDDEHLLTIGSDRGTCPGCGGGGVTLQLFDVSDLSAPRLTAKEVVGTFGGSSAAQLEHKAFNYFDKTGVLAIPFTDYAPYVAGTDYWARFISALKVYRIDAAGGITRLGEVDHRDLYRDNGRHEWAWWYLPQIRRSVQVEGFVYSFSSAGVKVNDTASLATTVRRVPFALER